jgi:glycogen phosphorylase/synthase
MEGRQSNPEFTPDDTMFLPWKAVAAQEGLIVKTGRWNIKGNPRVMLVDFTPYFGQQNEIFARFWETYSLTAYQGSGIILSLPYSVMLQAKS